MNARQIAIVAVIIATPVAAFVPLLVLPDTDTTAVEVAPSDSLRAWAQEVRTGAQLPEAVPARRWGRQVQIDSVTWMTLRRGDECWGLRTDRLAQEPERLELDACGAP